jgi:hypothetical protein
MGRKEMTYDTQQSVAASLSQRSLFDQAFPECEQLPRSFRVSFYEVDRDGEPVVVLEMDGEQVGDPLTDNSYRDDGYRYHDVFHFANAAILGWSPMTRKLFGCKRNSNPRLAVVEDGGRAKVLEEVVCALIYDYGKQRDFDVRGGEVEEQFVDLLRRITSDREVAQLDAESWRQLIEVALKTWKKLRDQRGGILEGDLSARRLRLLPRDRAWHDNHVRFIQQPLF